MPLNPNKYTLDTKLYEARGVPRGHMNCIGVEVEVEGTLMAVPSSVNWLTKQDGSLRQVPNGYEYVFAKPLSMEKAKTAFAELEETLNKCVVKNSLRCSTHVHVSVTGMTFREIYNAMCAYYLIEEVLIESQPKKRQGNLFCLSMARAEMVRYRLREGIKDGTYFRVFNPGYGRSTKYAAMNLMTLWSFGTLEFRFLDMMYKQEQLWLWSRLFQNLVKNGSQIEPHKLLSMYDSMPVKEFIHTLTGIRSIPGVSDRPDSKLNELIHLNYDTISDVSRLLQTKNKKYQVDQLYWEEDDERADERGKLRRKLYRTSSLQTIYDEIANGSMPEPTPEWQTQTTPTNSIFG